MSIRTFYEISTAYPIGQLLLHYGIAIALIIHSFNPSLFTQLIAR